MSRGVVTLAVCWALCAPAATALAAGFDAPASNDTSQQFGVVNPQRQDTPNDPDYDQSEPDGNPQSSSNLFDERFDLFGFASQLTRNTAKYHDAQHGHAVNDPQISGYNAAGAWKASRGRPDVRIAILDTGINWDNCGLRDKIALNVGELPLPRDAAGHEHPAAPQGGYDLNGDGAVNVDDWKDDARVGAHPLCGGAITGADLIRAFSNGDDADHNGYKDDIAGWDYFNNDNNPADTSSYFAAGNHGTGRANDAAQKANDGDGSLGVCPRCQIVPMRVWDTFVADANNFGMAMAYAADNGIEVIEGADGALYHSAFSEAASQYAYEHGAAQVYSGDDLNTGNHNYPANYNHTMLIQGVATDVEGLGKDPGGGFQQLMGLCPITCPGANAPVSTYFRGANTTQFGGHSSVSMHGPTGSINTGRAAGAAGLVISAARDAGVRLTPDETRIVMEQTAEDVTPANTAGVGTPDLALPGWDEHFGWGRVDLGKAVSLAASGKIPPEASIVTPDWYAPLTGASVRLTGRLRARFATGGQFHYKVEWGPSLNPTDPEWHTIAEADATGVVTDLGTLDLSAVRAALALRPVPQDPGGPVFSPTARNPYQDQFTVRVTVQATDLAAAGVPAGVDRKVLTAIPDGQGLRPGFPKRLGTGGEAPLRYADLNGDNKQELIVPTEDGLVHAYEPDGSELPGWPVRTGVHYSALDHAGAAVFAAGGVAQPLEPTRAPTVADLDGDGRPEVITAAGLNIYVWEADGTLRPGFPVRSDPANCDPSLQRKGNGGAWHRKCGFLATPAIGYLEGRTKPPAIVAASLDGHIYALRGDGTSLPGFPADLVDPAKAAADKRYAESINEPAIGDLNGDGRDDIVAATNEAYGGTSNGGDVSFVGIVGNAAGQSTRVYAVNGATGALLPGWPISISGLIQNVLPLIGPGHSPALVKVNGAPQVVASATSGKLAEYAANGSNTRDIQQNAFGPASNATDRSPGLNLFESAAVGDVLGTGTPAVVKYQVGFAQAANLLLVGQNAPYNHLIGAFDATTGAPLPAWPTITDDYQFLSSSTIAKVVAGPTNQVLAGTGLGLLHAYDGATGQDVAGFPKVTGGWLFAPAALSDDGRMAGVTREGYLFQWDSAAAACQSEWPEFRHDPQGTGNYNADGTAPGAPEKLDVRALGGGKYFIGFRSPGDDRMCGTAAAYVAKVDGVAVDLGPPVAGGTQFNGQAMLPAGGRVLTVQARDEVGNLGAPVSFDLVGRPRAPGAGPDGTGPDTGGPAGGGGGGGGAGGTGGAGPCRDTFAPRTVLSRRSLRYSRNGVAFSGATTDRGCGARGAGRVRRMWVGVYRAVPGACRWLQPDGRLGPRRSCDRHTLLPARGTSRWTFAKSASLPTGLYGVWALGDDMAGNREHGFSSARRAFFRLR